MIKCDYCRDRIDEGMEPACVNNCTTKCLHFGKPETTANLKRERYAKKVSFDREKGLEPAVSDQSQGLGGRRQILRKNRLTEPGSINNIAWGGPGPAHPAVSLSFFLGSGLFSLRFTNSSPGARPSKRWVRL